VPRSTVTGAEAGICSGYRRHGENFLRIAESVGNSVMRLVIHVRPGSSRATVGGSHNGALIVAVREPAEHGRATDAALAAVAQAFGVPKSQVRLVSGATSRRKIIDVIDGDPVRLAELLAR